MQNYALIVHTLPDSTQLPITTVTQPTYRVGVLGASGYSGRELCALILGHPNLTLAFATANAQRGTTLRVKAGGRVHAIPMVGPEEVDLSSADLVFAALPHGASAEWVAKVIAAGARVVDLSSDLRPGHGGTDHAPAGVPRAIIEKLGREVAAIVKSPEIGKTFEASGAVAVGSTPAEFSAFLKTETAKWGTVIREAGIKLEQ